MMFKLAAPGFVAFSACNWIIACADTRAPDDQDVVIRITAGHIATAPQQYPPIFSLAKNEIRNRQPTSTASLLRQAPGVDVSQQGAGGATFVSIRGGDPNFTVFVVDGVIMNDPTNSRGGAFDLSHISPDSIERIEIYAGGLSSVWGSSALAGVVNITTTKRATSPSVPVFVTKGSNGAFGGGISLSSGLQDHVSGSVNYTYQDAGHATEGDTLTRSQITGGIQANLTEHYELQINFLASDGKSSAFPEDSGGDRLAVIRTPEQKAFQRQSIVVDNKFKLPNGWLGTGTFSWTRNDEDVDNPGIVPLAVIPPIESSRTYKRSDVYLNLASPVIGKVQGALGASYSTESGTSNDIIDYGFPVPVNFTSKRNIGGLFADLSYVATPALVVTATGRIDFPEGMSSEKSARLGFSYSPPDSNTSLTLTYGEGFKLPSFFALSHPLVGNSALLPERSKSYEVRIDNSIPSHDGAVGMSLFKHEYTDLIDFDPVLFTNVNRSKVNSHGVELSGTLGLGRDMSVSSNITYNDAAIVGESAKLRRRPKWKGNLTLAGRINETMTMSGGIFYSGSFWDSSIPTGMIKMPGYFDVNVGLDWRIENDQTLGLRVENLLADDYEESIGFSNAGRRISVTWSATF